MIAATSNPHYLGAVTAPRQIYVARLFISPGHNFYGRYGQAPGDHALVERAEIRCIAGRGVERDRFFDYKPDYKGQITFLALEAFEDVCRKLGVTDKSPGVMRRNVVTVGVDLNSLIGQEFSVQGVRFLGTEESKPCLWMDQAIAPGAEEALRGNGGLRARILSDGLLRAGL